MKINYIKDVNLIKIKIDPIKIETCFRVSPLNNLPYPGVKINKVTILKPEFAKNIISKKTKRKIDLYLTFLNSILDTDGDSEESACLVLEDLIKFRETIMRKYSKFLSKNELAKLLKQLAFIESRLQMIIYVYENEMIQGKTR